jgi:hypothetical protein
MKGASGVSGPRGNGERSHLHFCLSNTGADPIAIPLAQTGGSSP